LKALIIDEEPDCVKLLALQLKMYCPKVQVVAECTESEEAFLKIKELQPDLVFMDIEMPVMNGFQLLEKIGTINFSLVFVTAYDKFAVKAFRFSDLDYLLKPIDGKDPKAAVETAKQRHLIVWNLTLRSLQQYLDKCIRTCWFLGIHPTTIQVYKYQTLLPYLIDRRP